MFQGNGNVPILANSSIMSGPSVPGGSGNSEKDLVYSIIARGANSDIGMSKMAIKSALQGRLTGDKVE
jgi:hypothetical protein